MPNTASKGYDDNERDDVRLLGPEEGLGAKATDFDTKKRDAKYAETLARATVEEDREQARQTLETIAYEEARDAARRAIARKQAVLKKNHAAGAAAKVRGAAGLARWGGITIAITAWFWQMLSGAVSLVGFGGRGAIDYFLQETIAGKVFNGTIGHFIDLHTFIPFDSLALAFWGIATLIGVCSFFGFLLFFYLTGAQPFHSTVSYLIGAVVFACCILPVANLFPAVPLWVAYINLTSTIGVIRATGIPG